MSVRPQSLLPRLPPAFARVLLLCSGILLANLLAFMLIRDDYRRMVFSDISAPLVDALAAVFLVMAARKSFTRSRRLGLAWSALAGAMILYGLGDSSWG